MTTCTITPKQQHDSIVAANDQALLGTLDSILVTYDTRIGRKGSKASLKPLSSIIEQIRTSADLQGSTDIIRAKSTVDERQELKAKLLPYFTFLRFSNNQRKKEFFQSVRFILLDLDHVLERIDELREKMRLDPDIFMFFVSPSGDGLKVVFALDREITTEVEYGEVYHRFRKLVKERYAVETDDIKDVARACFLSYDPDIYINENATRLFPTAQVSQSSPPKATRHGDYIVKALQGATPGARTPDVPPLDRSNSYIGNWVKGG